MVNKIGGLIYVTNHKERLEYLRNQIEGECISYGEIAELQGLAEYIEPGDVELAEWADIPEDEFNDPGRARSHRSDFERWSGIGKIGTTEIRKEY